MDAMILDGGVGLKGEVKISGAKNAALPIMMASVLMKDPIELRNVPRLRDINTTRKLLLNLGCEVSELKNGKITIDGTDIRKSSVPYELVKTMRASVLLLGPILARKGKAVVSLPGGCAIGARPINYHLTALEKMGAKIHLEGGNVIAEAKRLRGAEIRFPEVTVTGTENIMMAACFAKGRTILHQAAQEPEVVDLAEFLCKAGAQIRGAGTSTITIEGVGELYGCRHDVIADRIEAGTFLIAAGVTGGDLVLKGATLEHNRAVVDKLREAGLSIFEEDGNIHVKSKGRAHAVDLVTSPYPGFPTDMQAQFMVLMATAKGKSVVTENIFENRYMHVSELARMGARIRVSGKNAVIQGVTRLDGARLMATDLRASASLILAGLCARGQTRISRVYHLDRGYERIERKLRKVGARIRRVTEDL